MQLTDFNFSLPEGLIALDAAEPRDQARLLVYDRLSQKIQHAHIYDLPDLLPAETILVANNSKVRKSRLTVVAPTGHQGEILLLEPHKQGYHAIKGGRLPLDTWLRVLDSDEVPSQLWAQLTNSVRGPGLTTYTVTFNLFGSALDTALKNIAWVNEKFSREMSWLNLMSLAMTF